MSQSTPIFNIPRDNYQQNDQQARALQNLIDDNVDEMQPMSVDQAYQMQQMQQMQPQPMPTDFSAQRQQMPPMEPQNQFNANLYIPNAFTANQMGSPMGSPMGSHNQMMQQMISPNAYSRMPQSDDWYSYVVREFKDSIIIAMLFVILNISFVQRILQLYVPYMDNVYLELIVRGIMCGTLFHFVKRFFKN